MRYAAGFEAAMMILVWATVSYGESGFDPRYERDYNIFNPVTKYNPNNPFNPVNRYDPDNPLNPVNKYNLNVPFAPLDGSGRKPD